MRQALPIVKQLAQEKAMRNISILLLLLVAVPLSSVSLAVVEIGGKVVEATGDTAKIAIESEFIPNVGDKVRIFFKIPGLDDEVLVGTGRVIEISADFVQAKIETATGTIDSDHLANITSESPRKKTAPPAAAPPVAAEGSPREQPSPPAITEKPPDVAATPPVSTEKPPLAGPSSPQEKDVQPEATENARLKAQEEAREKSELEARLKAMEAAQRQAAEEAQRQAAELEARLKAAEEARQKAAEAARLKAEEEARQKAELAARLQAMEDAQRQAAEEARRKAEEDARRSAARSSLQQGLAFAAVGRLEESIQEFSAAIDRDPQYAVAYANRGTAYIGQKKYDRALNDLKKAVELNPQDQNAFYNLAVVYTLRKEFDSALGALDQALRQGFDNYDALREDRDLEGLRKQPEFRKVLERHKVFLAPSSSPKRKP
jgi:Flp pilus assembly protein TadD